MMFLPGPRDSYPATELESRFFESRKLVTLVQVTDVIVTESKIPLAPGARKKRRVEDDGLIRAGEPDRLMDAPLFRLTKDFLERSDTKSTLARVAHPATRLVTNRYSMLRPQTTAGRNPRD
jgi:hypothetical protein